MKVNQYRPAFFQGFENEQYEFFSVEELLSIPFISNFSSDPNFYRFSVFGNMLMAEYRGGREWWVVANFENPNIELPKWNKGIYAVIEDGVPKDIPGTDVKWARGDEVGLRDGRVLKANPKRS